MKTKGFVLRAMWRTLFIRLVTVFFIPVVAIAGEIQVPKATQAGPGECWCSPTRRVFVPIGVYDCRAACFGSTSTVSPSPGAGGLTPQQQMGLGILEMGIKAIFEGGGNSQQEAQRKAEREAQLRAEQEAQEVEQKRIFEEQERQAEASKKRILGMLKGLGSSGELNLKMVSDQPLMVTTKPGPFGITEVVPVSPGTPSVGGLQLKLGDEAEKMSVQARQGFDTAGKMKGADISAPPAAPPTFIEKLEKTNDLKYALMKNREEEEVLKALLEKLRQSPNPDETEVKVVQNMIATKEDDKKKIEKQLLDLTAKE